MKLNEALIAWTSPRDSDSPTAGRVKVGPLLKRGPDWTAPYESTGGAAFADVRAMTGDEAVARVFIDFHTLVMGDGLDPKVVHEAFLAIDEYAEHISPDIPGARQPPEGDD